MVKTPAGEPLSPKRTYRIEFGSGRKALPLFAGIPTRADAQLLIDGAAKRMGYDPSDLVIVGSAPPAPVTEATAEGEESW